MENNLKNIDDLFKEELGGYTEAPPPPVWQALEKRLDDDRKRRVIPFRWYWFISVLSFMVLFGASIAWKLSGGHSSPAAIADVTTTPANTAQQPGTPATSAAIITPAATATAKIAHRKTIHHQSTAKHHKHIHHKTTITGSDYEVPAVAYSDDARPVRNIQNTNHNSSNSSVYTYDDEETMTTGAPFGEGMKQVEQTVAIGTDENDEPVIKNHKNALAANQPVKKAHRYIAKRSNHTIAAKTEQGQVAQVAKKKNVDNINKVAPVKKENKQVAALVKEKKVDVTHMPLAANVPAVAAVPVKSEHKKVHSSKAIDNKDKIATTVKPTTTNASAVAAVPAKTEHKKVSATVADKVVEQPAKKNVPAAKDIAATAPSKADTKPAVRTMHVVKPETNTAVANKKQEPKAENLIASTAPIAAPVKEPVKQAEPKKALKKAAKAAAVKKEVKQDKPDTKLANIALASSVPVASKKEEPAEEKALPSDTKVKTCKRTKVTTTVTKADKKAVAATPAPATPARAAKTTRTTGIAKQKTVSAKVLAAAPAPTPKPIAAKVAVTNNNTPAKRLKPNLNNDDAIEEPALVNAVPQSAAPKQEEAPVQAKKKITPAKDTANVAEAKSNADVFRMFVYGIKGGYEGGLGAGGANKGIISPFLEYRLNSKFSLMTQPAFKVSHASPHSIGNSANYFDTSADHHTYVATDSGVVVVVGGQNMYQRKYDYKRTYDSIVKTYAVGGTYVEAELPLLLKYNISSKLSIYGGVNAGYSRFVPVKEITSSKEVEFIKPVATLSGIGQPGPDPSTARGALAMPGTSIAGYNGPLYPSQNGGALTLGYMLGFSYEYKKRWIIDALIQQSKAKSYMEGGYNANTALSLPYFRLTVGYRLSK